MTLRVALIGCGKIGSEFADDPKIDGIYSHAGAYAACRETSLVAVCDNNPAKLERCGERWNVPLRYSQPQQMLAEQAPDIVSICTPDDTHADLIYAALYTPGVRAILAEKPLALDSKTARKLVQVAAEKGVVLAVNYSRRYAKNHIDLKKFLQTGGIGQVQTINGYYTKGVRHNGTHWFDLLRFLVGEVTQVWGCDRHQEATDDPTLDAFLRLETGASAFLHGCDAKAFSLFELDLIGERGRVRIVESGHVIEVYEVADSPYYSGYQMLTLDHKEASGMGDVLLYAVQDLVNCLTQGGQPRCSGTDGVAALEIAQAVCESACSGVPLRLRSI